MEEEAVDTLKIVESETQGRVTAAYSGNVARFPGVIGTFMGRDALSLAVAYLGLSSGDTVLLPLYTCQEVLRQFARKCNLVYYDIKPDLTIDPDEVAKRLRGQSVRMMLITNYFGFLQPYRNEIRQMCTEKEICVIEDCAHSLLTDGSGETGDLAIYSFRKILPVSDGGGLKVNHGRQVPLPKYRPQLCSDVLSVLHLAKSFLNIHTEKLSRAGVASRTSGMLPLPTRDDQTLPLSSTARLSLARTPFAEVTRKRREDFEFWRNTTTNSARVAPVFEDLPSGVCPLGFAVRIKGRREVEARARAQGIPLRVHWRLDASIGRDCPTSHELSGEMLTLPVYPELGPKERDVLGMLLARE